MKADFTRDTFDPLKHFSRVVMQQGRVQLDADWNEQTAILLHTIRRLASDLLGSNPNPDGGFLPTPIPKRTDDFEIAAGSFYVDGILCEAGASPVAILTLDTAANTAVVAQWTVDGVSFQPGQTLRLTDDAAPAAKSTVVATITRADYDTRLLTFDIPLTPLKDAALPRARRLITYLGQPDLPKPPALPAAGAAPVQLYLDVWERLVTPLEDDSIREVALNGADTADRARVVWQVKALPLSEGADATVCLTSDQIGLQLRGGPPGLLRARVRQGKAPTDPCTVPPGSSYRGTENQLYRVEVNTGSDSPAGAAPSFKWSRDNGSVIFAVTAVAPAASTTTVTLASLGRDERFGLVEGDYVELQDDQSLASLLPAQLLRVQAIDRTRMTVVLDGAIGSTVSTNASLHPLLRRWDHGVAAATPDGPQPIADGAMQILPGLISGGDTAWLALEDGLEILFEDLAVTRYQTGDFWLIPARVATGGVLWPQETANDSKGNPVTNPVARPPHGPVHHYAPLAIRDGTLKIVKCAAPKK